MKNPLLKCFLYFRKLKFSTPSLKTPIFLGEPLRVFHHCFFRCFHFTIDFYYLFWVFSLLIAFVHFITVSLGVFFLFFFFSPLILLLFFECFHFTKFLYRDCFLSGTSFLCCCTANATDLRELFLLSGVLYLTLRPEIWHNLLLSRLPWGRQFSLQGCRAFH